MNLKNHTKRKVVTLLKKFIPLVVGISISSSALADSGFVSDANLPTDVKPTCEANIAPWFGGQISANGWVEPANSMNPIFANFKNNTRCDFYKWGAQMFLWLTSGDREKHVFNTAPEFYNVSVASKVAGKSERTFIADNGPMLLGVRKGKTDDEIELGQAGGGDVLISQKNSLVYYGLHTNDVYALYLTGTKVKVKGKPAISSTEFPSKRTELNAVVNFANKYGYPIWDIDTMAIELKTSWIDAATLTNAEKAKYVLGKAVVPVFDRSAKKGPWTITGDEPKELALVGMHVVGTVNGHPEMVWSTFEHVDNVPDTAYVYTTSKGTTATKAYDGSGSWNFLPKDTTAAPTFITANAATSTDSSGAEIIVNKNGLDIGPVDNVRADPWGNDQSEPSTNGNTTDLVSINVSVLSQLAAGDIRGNYIQTGGIWTAKGQVPASGSDSNLRGSLNLANSTLETFYQFHNSAPKAFNPINCFGCHGVSAGTPSVEISHIYDDLQPLPKQ